jgi:hypothetical protein
MRSLSKAIAAAVVVLALTAAASAPSLAADAYELTMLPPPPSGSPTVFRLNVTTGQVSDVSGQNAVNTSDPQPLPTGVYRLYVSLTPDAKTFWLYRLETLTGRTWSIYNNVWSEVLPPK